MKNTKILTKILAFALIVLMMVCCFSACGTADTNSAENSTGNSQNATITVTVKVIAKDKSEKTFTIETDKKNLGDALFEEGLVTEAEHKSGYYTYIDGVRADYTADKAWWCFTKGGKTVMAGANDLEISDGDQFEITNTPA